MSERCDDCAELRRLTREGKARTYGISVSGVFQAPTGTEQDVADAAMNALHCFTGGWTVTKLSDDDQLEYDEEAEPVA